MLMRLGAVLAALLMLSPVARAQQPVIANPAPWNQIGATVTLAASGSTNNVTLGWVAASPTAPPVIWVHNPSTTVDAYVAVGAAGVTATTGGTLVAAGADILVAPNGATTIAAITGGGSVTLSISTGIGSPLAKGGGGGSGGGGATSITVGTTTITGGTANQLLYDNAGVLGEITKGNNCVYLTNGSGVPSCSTTLPTGLAMQTPASLVGTNITGTAAGLTAGNVTTNANLTGPITSTGNATAIASQTGTGSKFVVDTSPTLAGIPLTPTASAGTNTTQIASTAFVTTAVNNAVAGINPAIAVQAATTSAGNTSGLTYNNGAAGIGAFFTGSVSTAIVIDGYTFTALGQRLLVKNDTQSPSGAFNGVYYVTQVQTGILPPILTRALDYDQASDINNTGAIPVVNGTVNGGTSWLLTSAVATVGTDPLTYTSFTLAPSTIVTLADAQTLTGAKTFGEVHGTTYAPSLTSNNYTATTTDCGKILLFPTGTTPTLTLPNLNAACTIVAIQNSATQFTPQAASGGTLATNVNSFTKSKAQNAVLFFTISVPSASAATWVWSGDGA